VKLRRWLRRFNPLKRSRCTACWGSG